MSPLLYLILLTHPQNQNQEPPDVTTVLFGIGREGRPLTSFLSLLEYHALIAFTQQAIYGQKCFFSILNSQKHQYSCQRYCLDFKCLLFSSNQTVILGLGCLAVIANNIKPHCIKEDNTYNI
jgi:hypothetical protein